MPPVTDADADTTIESSLILAGLVIRTSPHRHNTLHLHPCFCAAPAPATRIAYAQPVRGAICFLVFIFGILRVPAQALMIPFPSLLVLFIYPV